MNISNRLIGDMDINRGDIVTNGVSPASMGDEAFRMFVPMASGKYQKANGLAEFAPGHLRVDIRDRVIPDASTCEKAVGPNRHWLRKRANTIPD